MKLVNYLRRYRVNSYIVAWISTGLLCGSIFYIYLPTKLGIISASLASICIFRYGSMQIKALLGGFVFGLCRILIESELIRAHHLRIPYGTVTVTGSVESKHDQRHNVNLQSIGNNRCSGYKVILSSEREIPVGSFIIAVVDLYQAPPSCVPRGYDYRYAMFFRRILGYGKVRSIEFCNAPASNSFRSAISDIIERKFNGRNKQIMRALLLGDASCIEKPIREEFNVTGLSHLLSISGLHFALFAGIFYYLGRWIIGPLIVNGNMPLQYIGRILSILGIVIYITLASPSWSVIRSAIMALIPIAAIVLRRKMTADRSVCLALFLVLLIWPYAVLDIGFQLSFIAVITLTHFRTNFFTSTLAVTLTTAPYLWHAYGYANLQPFIASVICIPFFSFILMPLLTLTTVTAFPSILVFYLDKSIDLLLYLVKLVSNIAICGVSLRIGDMPLLLWSIAIFTWVLLRNRGILLLASIAASILCINKKVIAAISISKDGKEIAFLKDNIMWARNPESFHSYACFDLWRPLSILPIDYPPIKTIDRGYSWNKIKLVTNKSNGRFIEAWYNDSLILRRWDMVSRKSPAEIALHQDRLIISFNADTLYVRI